MSRRRKDPFRYLFRSPAPCLFQIIDINNSEITSKFATAQLSDLHKSGCKLITPLNLNAEANAIKLNISVILTGEPVILSGSIRWQKPGPTESSFYYGIHFDLSNEQKERLQNEILYLASARRITVT